MARPIVLGNGNVLVCFDEHAQVKDFYFPYVGLENHISRDRVHRLGVWVDDNFSWLTDPGWEFSVNYQNETLASNIVATNKNLEVKLNFLDTVYNEKSIFLRNALVENLSSRDRRIKVFFNQQFQVSETLHADTVYYNPAAEALIHYKGRRVFLIGGEANNQLFHEYSTGLFGIEGKEGTWKDAEGGSLSQNPIEHGSVDSTLAFTLDIPAGGSSDIKYWITVAETLEESVDLQKYIFRKKPEHLVSSTQHFWYAWVNKFNFSFYGLDNRIADLFKKSLLIIRTHCDNRGGILASGDSDNLQYGRDDYAYVWPRDGAFVALALDKAGYFDIAERFHRFCSEVITREGYLLHKYQSDKSLGSSWHPWIKSFKTQIAIQEDETALPLYGLWQHYQATRDLEFIEEIYNPYIKNAAEFLCGYREPLTGLPAASYDLWEEKNGISTFTASAVVGALLAAGNFADLLGKESDKIKYLTEAEKIRKLIIKHLYSEESGYFHKLINVDKGSIEVDSTIDSSSFYGIFRFDILPSDDPRLERAYKVVEEKLSSPIPIGGVMRYEGDVYFRQEGSSMSNPWFITTLWMIQYKIKKAKSKKDLKEVNEKLMWIFDRSLESGVLSEQVDPYTGYQLSVSPLTWSHSEFVLTIVEYLQKLEELGVCDACYPVR